MKIYVLATDVSKFSETGFGSPESCRNFYKAIKDKYDDVRFVIIESVEQIYEVINEKPDLVICGFKYYKDSEGNKYWISELMENNNINLVGSPRRSIRYDSEKVSAKEELSANGINTPKYLIVDYNELDEERISKIHYPLFVKPVDAACSFGVDDDSIITNYEELKRKVKQIRDDFNQNSLVEEFLPGNEYTVGIIGNGEELIVAPIELKSPYHKNGHKFLPHKTKMDNLETHHCVDDIKLKEDIILLSKKAFEILGCRDLARIDIKLDANNKPSFMEINMLPGFNKGRSYYPVSFEKNFDMTYDETANAVVKAAIKRLNL